MRTGVYVALALLIAAAAAQQNIAGNWVFPWQYSGYNAVDDCYPSSVVITNSTTPNQVNVVYTFSTTVTGSAKCSAAKINATTISSTATADAHDDYYYDNTLPFDFRSQAQIGVLGVRISGGIYFEFSLAPASNPGPNEASYASALTGSFATVIPGTVQDYFWHARTPTPVNPGTCCIPQSIGVTIQSANVSRINATLTFNSSVTTNPWCQAANFTSGTTTLTGYVEQISTTYNVTAWSVDYDESHYGNAYDIIFFYDNSTLRVAYSVNNENAQGACGFDIDTSAVIA